MSFTVVKKTQPYTPEELRKIAEKSRENIAWANSVIDEIDYTVYKYLGVHLSDTSKLRLNIYMRENTHIRWTQIVGAISYLFDKDAAKIADWTSDNSFDRYCVGNEVMLVVWDYLNCLARTSYVTTDENE